MIRDKLNQRDANMLNEMRDTIGRFNEKQGWRNKSDDLHDLVGFGDTSDTHKARHKTIDNYLAGTMIALIHSELSEALEGLRKDLMDDHLPHRKMVEVEMADVLIRLFDFCDYFRLDLGNATVEKDEYNKKRSDHKFENRMAEGGKKF
jgi:NTP pyrophosphatase (non-canonical NTP hydrolase)